MHPSRQPARPASSPPFLSPSSPHHTCSPTRTDTDSVRDGERLFPLLLFAFFSLKFHVCCVPSLKQCSAPLPHRARAPLPPLSRFRFCFARVFVLFPCLPASRSPLPLLLSPLLSHAVLVALPQRHISYAQRMMAAAATPTHRSRISNGTRGHAFKSVLTYGRLRRHCACADSVE